MSDKLYIKNLAGGGTMVPSATWRQAQRKRDGLKGENILTGSGPAFAMESELNKLKNVVTQWGVYKEHTILQGAPNMYDQVTVTFQFIIDPPVYTYDFKAPTKSTPLNTHPSYKTFWDNDLTFLDESQLTITPTNLNLWQNISDGSLLYDTLSNVIAWRKHQQGIKGRQGVVAISGNTTDVTSRHKSGAAYKPGINSFNIPSVTITETIYFIEKQDYKYTAGPVSFSIKQLNSKTIAAMSGKVGWPFRTTYGYPKDVYTLLNDSDYAEFRKIGTNNQGVTQSIQSAFFQERGIPLTAYINPTNYPAISIGEYKGQTFGHPLWFCRSVNLRQIGYWYEAKLEWEYFNFGIDADLYPLATARVQGLA